MDPKLIEKVLEAMQEKLTLDQLAALGEVLDNIETEEKVPFKPSPGDPVL